MVQELAGQEREQLGEAAFLASLAQFAGFCRCFGVVATITGASNVIHHSGVHALLHKTGFVEDMRTRAALESNRETTQKDSKCTHVTNLQELYVLFYSNSLLKKLLRQSSAWLRGARSEPPRKSRRLFCVVRPLWPDPPFADSSWLQLLLAGCSRSAPAGAGG